MWPAKVVKRERPKGHNGTVLGLPRKRARPYALKAFTDKVLSEKHKGTLIPSKTSHESTISVNVFHLRKEEILSFASYVCPMDGKNVNEKGNRNVINKAAQDFLVKSLHESTWIIVSERP